MRRTYSGLHGAVEFGTPAVCRVGIGCEYRRVTRCCSHSLMTRPLAELPNWKLKMSFTAPTPPIPCDIVN